MRRKGLFYITLLLLCSLSSPAQNKSFIWYSDVRDSMVMIPAPSGYVNDLEGIFTLEQIISLDSMIEGHEKNTGIQIAAVTIDSLFSDNEKLTAFAYALFDKWGVGQDSLNNGIVIVFGAKQRLIRIQTGVGLQSLLWEENLRKIIVEAVIPEFKKKNYYEGIRQGILQLIAETD
ncbi:MAG: TPM domain-containing protein [Chitinophagaceae bacterium]|nr:TPM domain-containing protein [Chitinophagaceae bacterium]MBK8952221.1 TPM domain-containing protein [Chitinophagaceae bacterium]